VILAYVGVDAVEAQDRVHAASSAPTPR
jgi:hypothetical protein